MPFPVAGLVAARKGSNRFDKIVGNDFGRRRPDPKGAGHGRQERNNARRASSAVNGEPLTVNFQRPAFDGGFLRPAVSSVQNIHAVDRPTHKIHTNKGGNENYKTDVCITSN